MSQKQWLFVSDVDDTLLGDNAALQQLTAALADAPWLTVAYNSSRPCASLRRTMRENPRLRPPDFLIGALGTEILDGRTGAPITAYRDYLAGEWQRDRLTRLMAPLGFTPHPAEFQTPFKASYDVPDEAAFRQAEAELGRSRLAAKLIFSGGKKLDIIPQTAGKGAVIHFLQQWLAIPADRVVVAGDSGNDIEMFQPPWRGIIVGNADPDLKALQADHIYHAQAAYAAGVLEGLRYWQLF
jgi:sucrose-6-phosphatase